MGLLKYIFCTKKKAKPHPKKEVSGKCLELLQWSQYLNHISNSDNFISRKEYTAEMAQYSETMNFIISLDENDILVLY